MGTNICQSHYFVSTESLFSNLMNSCWGGIEMTRVAKKGFSCTPIVQAMILLWNWAAHTMGNDRYVPDDISNKCNDIYLAVITE